MMAEIKTVAVIGSGGPVGLGRRIALATVTAGYRTILEDILPASLRRADEEIRAALDRAIEGGRVSRASADSSLSRLEYAGAVEDAARPADLVIEAVPDEMESKLEIFTLLDRICRPHTILASTTTTLSLGDLASVTFRPEKILGMRFDPPVDSQVVELTYTQQTEAGALDLCMTFARRLGREVVVVAEAAAHTGPGPKAL